VFLVGKKKHKHRNSYFILNAVKILFGRNRQLLGEFDYFAGNQLKPARKGRNIEEFM
jgi:hypothetical protein